MKKSTKLSLLFLITVTTVIGLTATFSNDNEKKIDELTLQNIEALSAGENNGFVECFGKGSVICPNTGIKVVYVIK